MTNTITKPSVHLLSTFSPGMLKDKNAYVQFSDITRAEASSIISEIYCTNCYSAVYDSKIFCECGYDSTNASIRLKNSVKSGIGHPATADMVETMMCIDLPKVDPNNRTAVALLPKDVAVVIQYIGPRLKEGEIMHNPDPNLFTFLLIEVLDFDAKGALRVAEYYNWQ